MRNYITYNGVDLREYGLYISGQGAFNSPARDYEQIVIPGRDGVLLGKEDKLNETELTYRGFIYKDFRENVAKLRAFLLSNKGFFRLTDTYNPAEFRLALYEGELIVEPTAKNNAGEFDLTFLVQPQRYLLSGEEITTVDAADPPSETYSGEIVTFEDPDGDKTIQSLTAQINPVQAGSGDPSPQNIRPISGWTGVEAVVSPTQDAQDGTTYSVSWQTEAGTVYDGEIDLVSGGLTSDMAKIHFVGTENWLMGGNQTADGTNRFYVSTGLDAVPDAGLCDIFPLKPYDQRGNAHRGEAFYVSANTIQVTTILATSAEEWKTWLVNNGGMDVLYQLSTVQTYQLTPTQISTLLGQNNIWADTGDVAVVVVSPFTIENPTLFDAKPLLRVYGAGTVGIGDYTFTISEADEYTDIDCEMMDCFKGAANKNPYVTFSNYEFPVLVPGVNKITMGAGITKIEITPRWYSV